MTGEAQKSFAQLRPFIRNKLYSQEFNHVVNDENTEFVHFFGLFFLKCVGKHTVIQLVDDSEGEFAVGLEQNAHQVTEGDEERVFFLIFFIQLLHFFLLEFIFFLGLFEGLLTFVGLLHFLENLFAELLNLLLGEESSVDHFDAVLHGVDLVFDHVGEVLVFRGVPQQLDKLTGELTSILRVFGVTRLDQTTQARHGTLTDFEVAGMVAEWNNDIEGFIDVRTEMLAHLINDDRHHVNGDGGLFGVVGLEVLSLVVVAILAHEHLLQKSEDLRQDLGQVVTEIVTHDQH